MLTTGRDIKDKLKGIALKNYRKFMDNIHGKRTEKQKTQLQAALMLGCVRRVK